MSRRVFIVDTNVLVAGLITPASDAPTARIVDAMLEGSLVYLLSGDLLQEYRDVLLRPRLYRYHGLGEDDIDQILAEIAANAVWFGPPPNMGSTSTSPDPRDAQLWAFLACEPNAVLITGDRLLLENPMPGRSIISPAAWFDFLGQ
jgi:putative PIN family toxin of toxin-antitoxin system